MENTRQDWRKRVLNRSKYMVATAMGKTFLYDTKGEALKEIAKMPSYSHPVLYKKINLKNDANTYECAAILRDLNHISMVTDNYAQALKEMFTPVHKPFHRTLFARV